VTSRGPGDATKPIITGVPAVQILPFVAPEEVLLAPDGSLHKVTLSVFADSHGGCTIRVGETIYNFNADGSYDGVEMRLRDASKLQQAQKLVEESVQHRTDTPKDSYFESGSRGYARETAVWPKRPGKKPVRES
jgi:hypothetical protein